MNVIETHNLTKYYGKDRGIIDLNLEIREGGIFGFIGPNGAGKSTTIRTLLGLIFPSIGIVVGGYFLDSISRVTPAADKFGYISPFKFVDSGVMRPDYGLDWWRVLYFVAVSLLLFGLTFWIYRKKDILI